MNKLSSTKERIFISLNGPSGGSGKSHFIFDWLKIGIFNQLLANFFTFINIINPSIVKCKEKNLSLSKE